MTYPPEAPISIGYCTNVFSGVSLGDILDQLDVSGGYWSKMRSSPNNQPVGLWLPARSAQEVLQTRALYPTDSMKNNLYPALETLREVCTRSQLEIYSINGFPFGKFHNHVIKEQVFFPDWTNVDRLNYTLNLLEIASCIAKPDQDIGISTVPISWKPLFNFQEHASLVLSHLLKVCEYIHRWENEKGVKLHLDLEPEPFGFLETSEEVVAFYKDLLLGTGAKMLQKQLNLTLDKAEELILDKIRICYDTCHAAVEFESPDQILKNYRALGIQVGKVQISSALSIHLNRGRCTDGTRPSETLKLFSDQNYLHQVIGYDLNHQRRVYTDLPLAIQDWEENQVSGDFRIHFHVPIYLDSYGPLKTTQDHIFDLISENHKNPICPYWEVETYTWDVLPELFKSEPLELRMLGEMKWLSSLLSIERVE